VPELPEVETLRRDLLACLPGQQVVRVEVLREDSIGFPRPAATFAEAMVGQRFTDHSERRGKYLLLHLQAGAVLGVHLRMSGRLLFRASDHPREPHLRVCFALASGHELRFEDMRVFGRLWLVPVGVPVAQVVSGLAQLGPEPFDPLFDADYLARRFRGRTQPLKSALLDQNLVAGIGNIYADEALFCSGLHPLTPVERLSGQQLVRLRDAIVQVLEDGIERRGSSLRNYTDAQGVNGQYAGNAWVYGRRGAPCRRCRTAIERLRLAGRSTHFCPSCQSS